MTAAEFLLRAVQLIDSAGLRYMVAGSFASSYYGESRTTRDLGHEVTIASAEDVMLAKLEWGAASGSERQIADARAIARVQEGGLDLAHLRYWAVEWGSTI